MERPQFRRPVPATASITASATAESRFALVASPGPAVWMAASIAGSLPVSIVESNA
jgi:hypothetical protein